jgi:hypothetical protein
MRTHNVPTEMQRRVQRWYDYSWSRGRMSGAGDVHSIKLLPDKLKTELALHVNLGTLKKVLLFINEFDSLPSVRIGKVVGSSSVSQ